MVLSLFDGARKMLKKNMDVEKSKTSPWLILAFIGINLPLMLILISLVNMSVLPTQGFVNVTPEHAAFFCGLYLALPSGVVNIILVSRALLQRQLKKSVAVTGIILGIVSILFGLLSWLWFFMVSSFTAAHGG
jgi:hypothetical protein